MEYASPISFLTGSPADWIIIAVVALLVFGPNKLPELGKQLGQAMREFNKMRDELTGAVHSVRDEVETAYKPLAGPYTAPQATSSPTVEAVTTKRVYDQDPEDMMAPIVPELMPADGRLLTPPPAAVSATERQEKGH